MNDPLARLQDLLRVEALPRALDAAAQARIDGKTKPRGALGRLEALALQLVRVQGTLSPRLERPWMLVFAGDHGIADEGVSAYPQDVTWQMVMNFLAGGAAINVFAGAQGLGLSIVDAGVKHDFGAAAGLVDAKIAPGTRNSALGPAMTAAQCEAALRAGAAQVDDACGRGSTVLGFGEMGIGNTASASLIVHKLGGVALADCTGRGTGLDDAALAHKRGVLERAAARTAPALAPLDALREYGGFEIAMIAGACLRAAQRRCVILVDGFIASAALLVAARLAPAVLERCVYAHASAELGHRRLLALLGAQPLLELELRLGEGTGAALAWPLLQAAAAFIDRMADFDTAGVSRAA